MCAYTGHAFLHIDLFRARLLRARISRIFSAELAKNKIHK